MRTARISAAATLIAVAFLGSGCGAAAKIDNAAKAVDKANQTVDICNNITDAINKAVDNVTAADKAATSDTDPAFVKKVSVEMSALHTALVAQSAKLDSASVKTAVSGLDAQVK